MVNKGRGLWLAALGSTILGVPALAQEASPPASDVVGPPALQDFELRPENQAAPVGEPRPTIAPLSPPAPSTEQQQQPATSEPVVTIAPPPAPVTNRPAPQRQPTAVEQRATRVTPLPPAAEVPAPSEPATDPTAEPPASPLLDDVGVSQPPASIAEPLEQAPLEPDDTGGQWWLYLLFAGLVAGLGFVALRRRSQAAPAVAAPAAPAPLRPATPAPPAPPVREEPARAWIDLEFRPLEAGTTASHATVKFELMVRNTGDGEARDVRIDGRMFNAGPTLDQEIAAYFGEIAAGMPAPRPLAAKTQMPYRGTLLLPREQVREVTVQGRRLFIPMVAFNVRYRWGDNGAGQTAASYLVGTESDPPCDKMGAFRLDLGPRIYRKVGQREHRLRRRL